MAEKLKKYFDWVKNEGGTAAQMRLSIKTSIPINRIDSLEDRADLIIRVKDAIKEVMGKNPPGFN